MDSAPSTQFSRPPITLIVTDRVVQSRAGRRAVPGHGVGRVCTLPRQQAAARDRPRPAQAEAPQGLGGRTLGLAALHTLAIASSISHYLIISYLFVEFLFVLCIKYVFCKNCIILPYCMDESYQNYYLVDLVLTTKYIQRRIEI